MYIIEEGKPYIVKGDKAYGISFGDNGKIVVNEEQEIELSSQKKLSYEEIVRKFNVEYMVQQRKKAAERQAEESEELKALREELEKVKKERDSLKEQLKTTKEKSKTKEEK